MSRSGPTKGGPQPRDSSPPSGCSTLITRAPRSPSICAACGPAKARDRSSTTMSPRGPGNVNLLRPVGVGTHSPPSPQSSTLGAVETLARRIRALPPSCGAVRLIAVDGPAGSGKTTYAGALAATLQCQVIHADDFPVPWHEGPATWFAA